MTIVRIKRLALIIFVFVGFIVLLYLKYPRDFHPPVPIFDDSLVNISVKYINKKFTELRNTYTIKSPDHLEYDLLQYFSNLILLSNYGTDKGYNNDPELKRELNEYGNRILIENVKTHILKKYLPRGKVVKRYYRKTNRAIYLDYIFFRKEQELVYEKTLSSALSGVLFSDLLTDFRKEKKTTQIVFNSITLVGGALPAKIERIVYRMKQGDVKGISMKNGYFILFLRDVKTTTKKDYKIESKRIAYNLASREATKLNVSINHLLQNHNIEVLVPEISAINFSFTDLNNQDTIETKHTGTNELIVAIAWGKEIRLPELYKLINRLPKELQYYFYHEKTRIHFLTRLLTFLFSENRIEVENTSTYNRYKREKVQDYLIKRITGNEFSSSSQLDSLYLLNESKILSSVNEICNDLDSRSNLSLTETLLAESGKIVSVYNCMTDTLQSLFSDNWIDFFLNSEPQKLLIDNDLINSLSFDNPYFFSNQTLIATYKNKQLNVEEYFDKINSLSWETILNIMDKDNSEKFINSILNVSDNRASINTNLLDELNIYLKLNYSVKYSKQQILFEDTLNIAYINNKPFRLSDFKDIIYNYPEWKKKKMFEGSIKENTIEKILSNKLWIEYAYENNLDKDESFIVEYNLANSFLLAQKVYMDEVYYKPLILANCTLNKLLRECYKENEYSKLRKILNYSLKLYPITPNIEAFDYLDYGLDSIQKNNYKNYLTHALKKFKNIGMISPIPYSIASFSDEKLWNVGDEDANELEAYWSFNEGFGSYCFDYSGNGYYGELANNTSFTKGKANNFVTIDKCDAIIIGNNNLSIKNSFTVSYWVNLNSYGPILVKSSGMNLSDHSWKFSVCKGFRMYMYRSFLNEGRDFLSSTQIDKNEWVFLSYIYDGENVLMYINGNLADRFKYKEKVIMNNQAVLSIGNNHDFTHYHSFFENYTVGFIDEISIYSRALTADEILSNFLQDQKDYRQ